MDTVFNEGHDVKVGPTLTNTFKNEAWPHTGQKTESSGIASSFDRLFRPIEQWWANNPPVSPSQAHRGMIHFFADDNVLRHQAVATQESEVA